MRNRNAVQVAFAVLLLTLIGPGWSQVVADSSSSSSSSDDSSSGAPNTVAEDDYASVTQSEKIVGGPSAVSPDSEHIVSMVDGALKAMAGQPGGPTYVTKHIINATQKVVSGKLYTIYVEFGDASSNDGPGTVCKLTVWTRAWLNDGSEYTLTCDGANGEAALHRQFRAKRSLLYDQFAQPANGDQDIGILHQLTYRSASELAIDRQFGQFQRDFNRSYASESERQRRRRVFGENLQRIAQLNAHEQGTAEYGVTQFADMTAAEFDQWKGLRTDGGQPNGQRNGNELRNVQADIPNVPVPRSFDWRDRGVISPVKNQGACGSCWAFSVIGNIEGLHAIRSGRLDEYSEQELVDCDTSDNGCNGGLPDNAYKSIEKLGGLELESDYPYAAKGQKCQLDPSRISVRVKGAVDLPANETAMAQWIVANGPLSIGLNANAMQFYRGGVSHPWRALCAHSKIDHGVLIVGFGQSDYPLFNRTMPYWIVKNSWGPSWGEKGYYRVFRGDNTCGINSMVSSAVLGD